MRKILILGAGRGQIGLYNAAKEMGLYTIAGTMPGDNLPCLTLADEVCYMNIADPNDVMSKASQLQFDGVATCCIDTGLISLGEVCDSLNLKGISRSSAEVCTDKAKMKQKLVQADVATARYFTVHSDAELENAVNKLQFPVVVKATDLQGSRGIYIASTREEVYGYYKLAKSQSKKDYCVVEEYIAGRQFGAEALVYNGKVIFVLPDATETIKRKSSITVGHYVPFDCDDSVYNKAISTIEKAIYALELNNCAVNVDLMLKDDEAYIIELTGRAGANGLPEIVSTYYGIDYYKMIISMAMDDEPLDYWNKRNNDTTACLTKMIVSENKSGIIKKISCPVENINNVVSVDFFKKADDSIKIVEDSNDCIGQLIVKGKDIAECRRTAEAVLSKVVLDVE